MKLPCYLVRDLLPLYKDQVCEPDTAAAVKEHLEECADCRALWEKMQGIAPAEVEMERIKAREEAAALQRVRRTHRKKRVLTALAAAAVTAAVGCAGLGVYAYAKGNFRDYDADAILGVEYETLSESWRIQGEGIVLHLDPAEYATMYWVGMAETEEGPALVFSVCRSLWDSWAHTQWEGHGPGAPYEVPLYTAAIDGQAALDRLTAVYYLPYSQFEPWEDSGSQTLPEGAELLWQRDDADAPAAP